MKDWISHFKNGGCLLIADDIDRENEVDLICSAEDCTESIITNMVNYGTGIICVPISYKNALSLKIPYMIQNNKDPHQTAFTVSCDDINTTTGVSSKDRCKTIKTILSKESKNLRTPGHIFPLIAKPTLLKERKGHTEASIACCQLGGKEEVAVIVECVKKDGTMLTSLDSEEIEKLEKECNAMFITIKDIEHEWNSLYNKNTVILSDFEIASSPLKTINGNVEWVVVKSILNRFNPIHLICKPTLESALNNKRVNIRVHSECCTSHCFGSKHCDCKQQFDSFLRLIENGICIYETNHEGRGIGSFEKCKAYNLQQALGLDTYNANRVLGHEEDLRNYTNVKEILK